MDAHFGKRLAHARAAKNMTQRELAEAVGITWSQISRYEAGKARPRLAVLIKLAEALEVESSTLTGERLENLEREVTLHFSDQEHAEIKRLADAKGVSFDDAVQMLIVGGLKSHLDKDPDLLARLEEDVPGAYDKLLRLLQKHEPQGEN